MPRAKQRSVPSSSGKKDFLTHREFETLLKGVDGSRWKSRDRAIIMVTFWHGARASETCNMRLADLDLKSSRLFFARSKGSRDAHHPVRGDVLRAIKRYLRDRPETNLPWLFVNERGEPLTRKGVYHIITNSSKRSPLPFPVNPHMLRHGCGYEILERTGDVRLAQEYLGHKDIKNTTRYTQISTRRFESIWRG